MSQTLSSWQQWRRNLKPAFATLSIRCLGRLPLLWNRALGRIIGYVIWWSRAKSVQTTFDNINKAFPELTPTQQFVLSKKSIIETSKTAFEIFSVWIQNYSELKRYIVAVENLTLLQTKSDRNKGLVVLLPHLGNWELIGSYLSQLLAVTFLYQPSGIGAMDDLISSCRSSDGVSLAPSTRQGVAKVLQVLRAGGCVGILPDQVPERESGAAAADFFGNKAWTMTLVHKLIQRTQCDVVMAHVRRVPKGFCIHFSEPRPEIRSVDKIESLNGMNRSIEDCVRQIPEQYQWEYKRYKRVDEIEIDQQFD